MAYTQSDLESVQAAIVALATGQRVFSLTIDGVAIQYGQADLDKLRALSVEMERSLRSFTGRPSFYLTTSSKGL